MRGDDGKITHHFKGAEAPVVICMQGRKVVMQTEVHETTRLFPQDPLLQRAGRTARTRARPSSKRATICFPKS